MSITRVRPRNFDKYTTVNLQIIEDPNLSPEAKVLWVYLISRPHGWVYNRKAAINVIGSSYKVDKAVKELKDARLIEVERVRENGRFAGYDWSIHTEPYPEDQYQESPDTDIPDLDIPDPDIPDTVIQEPLKEITSLEKKTKKKKEQVKKSSGDFDEPGSNSFSEFWEQYPRKASKQNAVNSWKKLKPSSEVADKILQDLAWRKQNDPQWIKDSGQFIPHPATYLNQRRWEDEREIAISAPSEAKPLAQITGETRSANQEFLLRRLQERRAAGGVA